MRALAESLQWCDILVTFGKMVDRGFMHCASLTILLECFDSYRKIVPTFGLLVCSGYALSWFKMFSFTNCLQITSISHDIARVAGETAGIHTFSDLLSCVIKSRHVPHAQFIKWSNKISHCCDRKIGHTWGKCVKGCYEDSWPKFNVNCVRSYLHVQYIQKNYVVLYNHVTHMECVMKAPPTADTFLLSHQAAL